MVECPLENGRCTLRTEDLTTEILTAREKADHPIRMVVLSERSEAKDLFHMTSQHLQPTLTSLDSTLTESAFVSPLSSTLTRPSRKNIKTRDFNSFRIRSYSTPSRKNLIRSNLTKHGGRGEGGPLICILNLLGLLYLLRSRIHHSPFTMSPASLGERSC